MLTVLISNFLIITQTKKNDSNRERLNEIELVVLKRNNAMRKSNRSAISDKSDTIHNHKKMSRVLLTISFTYAFLNLPYLIAWLVYFIQIVFNQSNVTIKNYKFGAVQIAEIFKVNMTKKDTLFFIKCLIIIEIFSTPGFKL